MAWPTFGQLIQNTQTRLSEVTGTSVDLYSEDVIAAYLQDTFDQVFGKVWLPEYTVRLSRTLDGTVGVATVAIADTDEDEYISRWSDIFAIFPDNTDTMLRLLPSRINAAELTGTYPRYVSARNDTKLIQFWPVTSTGDVYIVGRQRPLDFDTDDEVRLDRRLLVNGACWRMLESDSTSPGATERFQNEYLDAFKDLVKNFSNIPIDLSPGSRAFPSQWEERDW